MDELLQNGLTGIRTISSDDHSDLRVARKAVYDEIPRQRCQFHIQPITAAYVPKLELRSEVTRDNRVILDAPDHNNALGVLRSTIAKYETTALKLAR